ncbi:MAG: hypothetical protein Q9218_007320, partial [Villophora microphyllina]
MPRPNKTKPAEDPQPQQQKPQKAKKKKNEPGQQPAWMFPAEEANPVLNPRPKSEEQSRKEKEEWDAAIKFLKYRAQSTPVKPAPPKQLLTLIGAFLTAYGFNNTCRIYQLQCNARSKLDGWDSVLGETFPEGFPDLVTIYNQWVKTYTGETQLLDPKKAKQEKRAAIKEKKSAVKVKNSKAEDTSSSGSSSADSSGDNESDADMADPEDARPSVFLSSSSSSSDSDTDDESDKAGLGASARKPGVNDSAKKPKRKDPSNASSSSSSGSSSEEDEPASKKASKSEIRLPAVSEPTEPPSKKKAIEASQDSASSSSSSSSSSDSGSHSDASNSRPAEKATKSLATAMKAPPTHLPPKPALSNDSGSESSSDSEDNEFPVPKIDSKKVKPGSKPSSESSATLVPTPTLPISKKPTVA